MFYNNFYFDSADFDTPIKTFIDDKIWFKIMPKFRLDADVFVRRNYIVLQDNYIQLTGEDEDMFFSVSGKRETMDDYETGDQKLIRVYFRMDSIVDTYERTVYSSGDFLAQIGGIFSFLKGIGGVIVFIFSERLLVSALAGKLYQVYDEDSDKRYKGNREDVDDGMHTSKNLNRSTNKIHDVSVAADEENRFFSTNPVRNLYKNALYCRNKSDKLADKLKNNKELDEIDTLKIKNLVNSRKKFNYNTCHILEYLI
jgi:hypothetical protein